MYKESNLKHLRSNLFVNPSHADIVENNWNNARLEIEKLEVEADRIKHFWETIEDQTALDFKNMVLTNKKNEKPV